MSDTGKREKSVISNSESLPVTYLPGRVVSGYLENWPHLIHLIDNEGLPVRVFASVNHADNAPMIARPVNCLPALVELAREHEKLLALLSEDLDKCAPCYPENPYEKNRLKVVAVLAQAEGRNNGNMS